MLQNGFDDLLILNGADDPHGSPAFRAGEGFDLIDFQGTLNDFLEIGTEKTIEP
jgi:hypothetical protein